MHTSDFDFISLSSVLSLYTRQLTNLYGGSLVGVYTYGSLARGCYHPSTSDVDIIAVTRDGFAEPDDESVLKLHRNLAVSVDAVFVTESQLNADVFPTAVTYLVKPVSDYVTVRKPDGSCEFLLQRQDAYESGISLTGSVVKDLIRPVPWPLLGECLDYLFPHIVPNFKNPVLMLCRLVYAWKNRRLCSKREAGEWALESFGESWRPTIKTALDDYRCGSRESSAHSDALRTLESYCADLIGGYRDNSS